MKAKLVIFVLVLCTVVVIAAGCIPIPLLPSSEVNETENNIDELIDNNTSRSDVIKQHGNPAYEDESTISYFACEHSAGIGFIMCLGYQCDGVDLRNSECFELVFEFNDHHRLSGYKKVPFTGYKKPPLNTYTGRLPDEYRYQLGELRTKAAQEKVNVLRTEALQGKIDSASVLAVTFGDPSFLEKLAAENPDAQRVLTLINYGKSYNSSSTAGLTDAELSKHALQGDPKASYQLYWNRSDPGPHIWLCRAADLGQPEARYRLGVLYWYGSEGVKQDYVESYKWYALSAQTGNYEAWKESRRIKREVLTPDDATRANTLVNSWQPGKCEHDIIPDNIGM
jgi:hypothetical protein